MPHECDYSITLSQVPTPNLTIPCQELLLQKKNLGYNGVLRRKKPGSFSFSSMISRISWDRNYVILHGGCLYMYKNEQQKKPEKAISLFGYTQVIRAGDLRLNKDLSWTFKLVYVLDEKGKVHYFCAASEAEMKSWMRAMKKQMVLANSINLAEDDPSESDINDLETPISTNSYFKELHNLGLIRDTLGSDPDLVDDDDDDYIDIDDPPREPTPVSRGGSTPHSPPSPTGSSGSHQYHRDFESHASPGGAGFKDPKKNKPLPVPSSYGRFPTKSPQRDPSPENVYDEGWSNPPEDDSHEVSSSYEPPAINNRFNNKGLHTTTSSSNAVTPAGSITQRLAPVKTKLDSKPCLPAVKPNATKGQFGQSIGVADRQWDGREGATKNNFKQNTSPVMYLPPTLQSARLKPVNVKNSGFNDRNSPPRELPPVPETDSDSNRFVKLKPVNGGATSHSPPSVTQAPPPASRVAKLPPMQSFIKPTIEPSQSKFGSQIQAKSTAVVAPIQQTSAKKPPPPIVAKKTIMDLEAACLFSGDPGDGNKLMMKIDEEGVYMIRHSERGSIEKTLIVIAGFQLRKYKIHQNERKMFSLQPSFKTEFDSIHSLIAFYRLNNLPNNQAKLITPYAQAGR